jgi:hypothetical protein
LSAHVVDVLVRVAQFAAGPVVFDAHWLAHLQARAGGAAGGGGWELGVIDGVDASI